MCSSTWSSICFGAPLLRQGLVWRIGNGESAHFWTDEWSGCGTLCHHALDPTIVDHNLFVHAFWINYEWNTTLLYACLPPEVVGKILCIPISTCGHRDMLIWKHNANGVFSVKSGYASSITQSPVTAGPWKLIWGLNIPPKLKIFAWLFFQGRLLTNVCRARRHIVSDPSCPHCPGIPETMIHLFRDCPKASYVWKSIGGPTTMLRTYILDWDGWLNANILQKSCLFLGFQWVQLFLFTCWFIWKWRNKRIFDLKFQDPPNAPQLITQYLTEWTTAAKKVHNDSSSSIHLLSWQKPCYGHYKLNIDGTRTLNGLIGAGGVIRDHNGNWYHGFTRNIGTGEVLQAEAWGLFSGLQIANELGINHIIVETDSANLVNLLHGSDLELHPLGTLLLNCNHIIRSFMSCSVTHIHRERNMAADCLAKRSIDHEIGICRLHSIPDFAIAVLLDDIAGFARPRAITAASVAAS